MLLWGGYPNAITLLLIPLTFYLYLQRDRFSLVPFLATTTILSGAIFLTHSLSAVMFVGITLSTVIFSVDFFQKKLAYRKSIFSFGFCHFFSEQFLFLRFWLKLRLHILVPTRETFTGGVSDIRLALLSTRVLPLEWVIPLFACVIFFFLFSKKYKGNFFTVPAFLLTLWILVPMIFTQGI